MDRGFKLRIERHRRSTPVHLRANHLHRAGERAYRPGVLESIVELERVTRIHFEHEERLMVACNYPDLPKHATHRSC